MKNQNEFKGTKWPPFVETFLYYGLAPAIFITLEALLFIFSGPLAALAGIAILVIGMYLGILVLFS